MQRREDRRVSPSSACFFPWDWLMLFCGFTRHSPADILHNADRATADWGWSKQLDSLWWMLESHSGGGRGQGAGWWIGRESCSSLGCGDVRRSLFAGKTVNFIRFLAVRAVTPNRVGAQVLGILILGVLQRASCYLFKGLKKRRTVALLKMLPLR